MPDLPEDAPRALVLVVGPDPQAAAFIAALLDRAGIESRHALTGEAASEVASVDPPFFLVVLDGDLAALRSIRALRDSHRAAVATLLLAPVDAPDTDEAEAHEQGATSWIGRPVTEEVLIATVEELLSHASNPEGRRRTDG